jgi:hypothetical protein
MADENPDLATVPAATNRTQPGGRKRAGKRRSGRDTRKKNRPQAVQGRSIGRSAQRSASGLARRGKRLVEDAQGWADNARNAMPRFAKNMHLPSPPSFESITEANPVILGAVGLGIGVIIGALLPRDAFHGGMQGLGLTGTSSRSRRSSSKSRSKR